MKNTELQIKLRDLYYDPTTGYQYGKALPKSKEVGVKGTKKSVKIACYLKIPLHEFQRTYIKHLGDQIQINLWIWVNIRVTTVVIIVI